MKETENLASKKCVPCQGGISPMPEKRAKEFLKQVPSWNLIENARKIRKTFEFQKFVNAIEFVNKAANLCESEGHHADMNILYRKVIVTIYTHKIHGLHENDFILASKIDKL